MAGRDLVVKFVGAAEGFEKASAAAAKATGQVVSTQQDAEKKLKATQQRLEDALVASEDRIQKAREKAQDAAKQVEVAEAKLSEARAKYGDQSSQALQAEGRLEQARRQSASAAGMVTKEIKAQADTQQHLKQVTDDLSASTDNAGGPMERLRNGASRAGEHLALMAGAATAAASAVGAALYDIGAQMDDVQDTIRVRTGATGDTLAGLTDDAKAVATSIPTSFGDAASTVADLNTRLGLSGEQVQLVASQYLEAGRMLGESIDIESTTAAFSAFGIEGDAVSGAMDTLFRVSQATGKSMNDLAGEVAAQAPAMQNLGFTFDETAALVGSLDKAGIDSTATLSAMGKGLVQLAKEGEEPQEAFRRVTQEISDLVAQGDIAGAIDLASGVFGTKAANQFVGAVQSGTLALDDLVGSAGLSTDTIMGVSAETQDFAERFQVLKNRATEALEPLGSTVFNALGDALEIITPKLTEVATWLGEHPGLTGIVGGFLAVMTAGLIAAAAAQWILNAAWLASPITWIIVGITAIIAIFVVLWVKFEGFRDFWIGAWEVTKQAAASVADWFTGTLVPWFGSAWDAIRAAGQQVADFFTITVPGAFETARSWIIDKVTSIRDGAVDAFNGLRDGVQTAMDGVRGAAAKPINFVIQTVYNDGLRAMIHRILDVLHVDESVQLPYIEPIALARGAMMGDGRRPILWNEVPGQREAYIPINQSERSRALWMQAGVELGVIPMAEGGFLGKITGLMDLLGGFARKPWPQVAMGSGRLIIDSGKQWLKDKLFSWGSSGSGNFDQWWAAALAVAGEEYAQYKGAVQSVAQHESGMNPSAVNDWDINAQNGTPSKGLLQFIEPTFRAYSWPGHNDWLNPVDQILAFFRYVPDRYGSIWAHPGLQGLASGTGYVGYDSGGWLMPGVTPTVNATGRPEAVLTADQWRAVAGLLDRVQSSAAGRALLVRLADDQLERLARYTIGELRIEQRGNDSRSGGSDDDLVQLIADVLAGV